MIINTSTIFQLFLFDCFFFYSFLIWLGREAWQIHFRYLRRYIKISVSSSILVLFAESTDTFWCFFLAMSFYDNLFQLLSHSVWSFVGDFLFRSFIDTGCSARFDCFCEDEKELKCGVYLYLFLLTVFRYLDDKVIFISVTLYYQPSLLCFSFFLLSFTLSLLRIVYLLFCFLWLSCLFLSFTISSALFFCCWTYGCFSAQVCLYKCVCAHSSICEDPRGECEWHTTDTQQESILPTSYLHLLPKQERRESVSVWVCQSMWTLGVEKLKEPSLPGLLLAPAERCVCVCVCQSNQ